MKILMDKRIPGLEEALGDYAPAYDIKAMEGARIGPNDVKDADVLFVRTRTRCDASLLHGSSVRLVGTATIGTDHIDIPWCESHGIRVVNAPGCNATAVMQYVASTLRTAGYDPSRHTLGVIGKGHIGSIVTALYRRAGARVLVSDPPKKEAGFTDEDYLSLQEVLEGSDAVTFHVPYTSQGPYPTLNMLTGDMLRKGQIAVNASRGPVFHSSVFSSEAILIIDTWPFEENQALYSTDQRAAMISKAFIATPHIAGYSIEGKKRATKAMLQALKRFDNPGLLISETMGETPVYVLENVINSFDPVPLSEALKKNPEEFEILRSQHLRPEPKIERK